MDGAHAPTLIRSQSELELCCGLHLRHGSLLREPFPELGGRRGGGGGEAADGLGPTTTPVTVSTRGLSHSPEPRRLKLRGGVVVPSGEPNEDAVSSAVETGLAWGGEEGEGVWLRRLPPFT